MSGASERGRSSTESFSVGGTEHSSTPRDVLALGRKLVEELELGPGVDTLGRWMAHHVAELMLNAEHSADLDDRRANEDRAVDTILRIWDHRATSNRVN